MTISHLCRISVQPQWFGMSEAVDLALPAETELGEMMPSILDLVGAPPDAGRRHVAEHYTLARLNGCVLNESMSLQDNDVRDGDLLLLAVADPVVHEDFTEMSQYVVACAPADHDTAWSRRLGVAAWLWSAAIGATALGWQSHGPRTDRVAAAAVVAVAAAIAATFVGRADTQPPLTAALGATAAAFGAVAGFLMVPGGPAPPNLLLAATVCAAIATVLLHVTCRESALLIAIAAGASLAAIVAAGATVHPVTTTTLGAVLAAVALVAVCVAAKVSVYLAGLSPRLPDAHDALDVEAPAAVAARRAKLGHDTLTGLLAGFSLASAAGVILVAADPHRDGIASRITFACVVSAALVFRACQQYGTARRTALLVAGLACATAAFLPTFAATPTHAVWAGLTAVALGAGGLWLSYADFAARMSPFARRGFEVAEYFVLAAVVPVACWVSGVFGLVRGLSLT